MPEYANLARIERCASTYPDRNEWQTLTYLSLDISQRCPLGVEEKL